jgi:hypothetical protein
MAPRSWSERRVILGGEAAPTDGSEHFLLAVVKGEDLFEVAAGARSLRGGASLGL